MEKEESQQQQIRLLRSARKTLGITSLELGEQLGVKPKTLRSWLEPTTSNSHRAMPKPAKMLLARILADHRAKK